MKQHYHTIGLMSGTSLDGLDICYVCFHKTDNFWNYEIKNYETIIYSNEWANKLMNAKYLDVVLFKQLDIEYGFFLGNAVNDFIQKHNIDREKIDLISSHGHTIFHQPENGITVQIGHGSAIAKETALTVVCDFRTQDLVFGGQGAPLVPIGDRLLFHANDVCLNLGGFSNVSIKQKNNSLVAFDICAVNCVLNHLAQVYFNRPYDEDGKIAKEGKILDDLLDKLNEIPFYKTQPPKSLGIEWVVQNIYPLFHSNENKQNILATYTTHCAIQIANIINQFECKNLLVTGGGAHNQFLMNQIETKTKLKINLPNKVLIDFKESLIFAFLGVLKIQNKVNIMSSVTGSYKNHSSGIIYNFYPYVS
jgi:anhydro-N-acetylmuramic acid kinase